MDPEPYDVLAVELSSFQLHYTDSMSAESAAVLNVAEDHLDWYGPTGMADYAADKGRIYERVQRACVYNVADPETERLVREADVGRAPGRSGSPWACPASGMLGVVEDILADRAFIEQRDTSAAELCTIADLALRPGARTSWPTPWPPPRWPAPTASRQAAVRDGLRAFRPDGHRIAAGRRASTASAGSTTPRPPTRTPPSPRCRPTTPWSGSPAGLAKGAGFDDLVVATAGPAAGRRAPRPRPRRDRRRRFRDTRPMCPSSSSRAARLGPTWWRQRRADGARRGRRRRAGPARGHRAPGPRMCLDGHVRQLRRPRRRVRRGGRAAAGQRPRRDD